MKKYSFFFKKTLIQKVKLTAMLNNQEFIYNNMSFINIVNSKKTRRPKKIFLICLSLVYQNNYDLCCFYLTSSTKLSNINIIYLTNILLYKLFSSDFKTKLISKGSSSSLIC